MAQHEPRKHTLEHQAQLSCPKYFSEISRTLEVSDNLKISLISRQALISLKLYATTPSYRKHTEDLSNLRPSKREITEALRL
jgi:hypothetical protein